MRTTDLQRARLDYKMRLDQSLASIVERLKQRPDVLRVSVFGSYACGRLDLFTDLDLLVIMETQMPFIERQCMLYELAVAPVDVDILCYTPQEFEMMQERPFLREALRHERVLYEKKPA